MVGFDHQLSLGFNMNYKGFTQFYTNAYEYLHSMNGKLFTAHNGKLYQNEVTSLPNNLVGQEEAEATIQRPEKVIKVEMIVEPTLQPKAKRTYKKK